MLAGAAWLEELAGVLGGASALDDDETGELEGDEAEEELAGAADEGVCDAVTGQTVTDTALVDVTTTTSV